MVKRRVTEYSLIDAVLMEEKRKFSSMDSIDSVLDGVVLDRFHQAIKETPFVKQFHKNSFNKAKSSSLAHLIENGDKVYGMKDKLDYDGGKLTLPEIHSTVGMHYQKRGHGIKTIKSEYKEIIADGFGVITSNYITNFLL